MGTQDLIYLVACAVNGEVPEPERTAGMDREALYKLASRHFLAAAAAPALEAAGIKDARFIRALEHSALKNARMDMEADALFAGLDAAGIWYMPLKGIVLQHMYPIYGMRQMSDHDILFDADRAEDVKTIMEGLGFYEKSFGTSNHDVYHKEPVSNFQMHRALFGPAHDKKLYEYYRDVQSKLLGSGCEKHLGPEDFYLYVTAHEYKHYANRGTGLRSLLDTYVVLQRNKLDMDYVQSEAKKLGIATFEAENRVLAQKLFSGGALDVKEQEMLDYVMSSGIYGTMEHRVGNAVSKYGGSRLRYALSRFLVPVSRKNRNYEGYASMYPVFYRYKILLPFLPFYRTVRAVRSGRLKAEAEAIKNVKA